MTIERSVVLGAGVAGLAAAAALRPYCDEVVIVERDRLPAEPTARRGVPQAEQLHNLLSRGQRHLEELLPGFCQALSDAGAGDASVADQTHVFELGIQMPERSLGLRLMCAGRPVIEHVARRLLLESEDITIRQGGRAVALEIAGGRTTGVVVETAQTTSSIPATLVVDATGSSSQAPLWLKSSAMAMPEVNVVRFGQWYATMLYSRPDAHTGKPDFWLTFPSPPGSRGGLVAPLGTDFWYVSMSGRLGDVPPRNAAEMETYAASLEDPAIAELLQSAEPIGSPHLFRKLTSQWRRYDLLDGPLTGFLPIGDAFASLNPLFGQGMSVAAWQAAELADLLASGLNDLDKLTQAYLGHAAHACQTAWNLGELLTDPASAWSGFGDPENLATRIEADAAFHRLYVGVWHLIEPITAMESYVIGGDRESWLTGQSEQMSPSSAARTT